MKITRTDYIYLAMGAMLRAVHHFNRDNEQSIRSVLCPGLGTGTGKVPPREAARQMALAYRNFLNPPNAINWHFADLRQSEVRYGGDMGFGFPPME
jgi:O-acetyl-ADP-ribose deacetylase (regulator of RNase III)